MNKELRTICFDSDLKIEAVRFEEIDVYKRQAPGRMGKRQRPPGPTSHQDSG